MKTTDFSEYLRKFLTEYLPGQRGSSVQTIDSYRYTFIRYLEFMLDIKRIRADKIKIRDFTYKNVSDFLDWLESECKNSPVTRNQRLAALKSFATFLLYEYPDYLDEYQKILSIRQKRVKKSDISYAKASGMKIFLDQIDRDTPSGLRDYTLFSVMYFTGIRVSEVIQIKVKDVSLKDPKTLRIHGKGNKIRIVPIIKQLAPLLEAYLSFNRLDRPEKLENYLFTNKYGEPFQRQGINYLVDKYTKMANKNNPGCLPEDFSPHKIRHSTAMSLLDSDVDLIYIRDLLGHTSVSTTEIYAKTETAKRRRAIEEASKNLVEPEEASWENNKSLKDWLKSFNKT